MRRYVLTEHSAQRAAVGNFVAVSDGLVALKRMGLDCLRTHSECDEAQILDMKTLGVWCVGDRIDRIWRLDEDAVEDIDKEAEPAEA